MDRRTITLASDRPVTTAMTGLVQLGDEHRYELAAFHSAVVLVGAAPGCHIEVDDRYISRRQFALVRGACEWRLAPCGSAKNPTYLNGLRAQPGTELPLTEGAVLRAGTTAWVVTSHDSPRPGEWYIAARNLDEFYTAALEAYGSARKAADAIGVDQRTYLRRIREIPGAAEILARQMASREHRPASRKRTHRPLFGVPARIGLPDDVPR